ncbi:MAG: SGNH/GDSL hydrolase family protein [Ferruginibacter sp.]
MGLFYENYFNTNGVYINMAKLFFTPVILLVILLSCSKKENYAYGSTDTMPAPTPTAPPVITSSEKTYLALGDSYTIGQSVAVADRFPNQTANLLLYDSIKVATPEIIAQTGWTTSNLLSRINSTPPTLGTYDIVTLLIGVNNQYQHMSIDLYRSEFTLLLNKSITYAANKKDHVFVLSIPDYSVTPFASGSDKATIAAEIDAYNKINKEITLAAGCNYVDITSASRQAATDISLIANDGLHPSGKQYNIWSTLLIPFVKAALR